MKTESHQIPSRPLTASVAEAAQLLGVGKNRVYELIREGRLPVLKLSTAPASHKRIPRRALEELVEAAMQGDQR